MKNIFLIFARDVRRIHNNVIAIIVLIGILVVPCLYAWFNIAASWDPYSNTGNLKVAVASVDEGYTGSLIPIEMNVGDQVISALRENTQMDWVFTSEEKALEGVKSGDYYAAIVVPEDFSTKIMSIFSENIEEPEIVYYSNAKENAIAPKVTDKGATAIQKQVNEVFVETISDTAMTVLQSVANMAEASGADTMIDNFVSNLEDMSDTLTLTAGTLQTFSAVTDASQQLLDVSSDFMGELKTESGEAKELAQDSAETFSDVQSALQAALTGINTALKSGSGMYSELSAVLDDTFEDSVNTSEESADALRDTAQTVDKTIESCTALRDSLKKLMEQQTQAASEIGKLVEKLDESITLQTQLRDDLNEAADDLDEATSDVIEDKKALEELVADNEEGFQDVQKEYEDSVQGTLEELSESIGKTSENARTLLTRMEESADGVYELSGEAGSDLSEIGEALDTTSGLLEKSAGKLSDVTEEMVTLQENGEYSAIEDLISDNRSAISTFLAAPVELETTRVFPIENYGSSMAPFYSTLSIWIGGIVLVAMLKVTVSENCIRGLKNVRIHQMYLGRSILFFVLGILQSTLIALGDLFYLGIQCEHPFLFLLACWFSSIVYVSVSYTLTVSFGDIGKAASVILLVMQVAGTGGTFPIECAPKFFRAVYPLLPFTHSMAAMREAVGGLYGMDYWIDLGRLSIFLWIALFVGLVLRRPIIRMNEAFTEKLEETKLI